MQFINDKNRRIGQVVSMPIIWSLLIPFVVFDIWSEIYHRTCFKLYGLKYIKRSEYIKIDRHKLQYLKPHEKLSCAYCGYANGLINYWTAIYAATENYWCGIMHKKHPDFKPSNHHKDFLEYDDEKAFNKKYR